MKTTYLTGSMEAERDLGAGWRTKLTERLADVALTILDPSKNEKEKTGYDIKVLKDALDGWRAAGEWDKFNTAVDRIMATDVKCVEAADFLILYINKVTGGTTSELMYAWLLKKPVYAVVDCDIRTLNCWVLRLITKYGQAFGSWKELETKVREVCA
jgi:hypothetical protein